MKYAVVYSSQTGNTEQVAKAIQESLKGQECVGFGAAGEGNIEDADLIFAGFWTDKGSCSADMTEFLGKLHGKKIALFGTAGFGTNQAYFDMIFQRASAVIAEDNTQIGTFMCQGRMPDGVRARYEAMKAKDADPENQAKMQQMIANFDQALPHPDEDDLRRAGEFALHMIEL